MDQETKRRAGRVLRFAVTGALLAVAPLGCGSSTEETTSNEPVDTNEPAPNTNEPAPGDTTGGDTGDGNTDPPPDPINTNEPAGS